jgi:hypothetical protein
MSRLVLIFPRGSLQAKDRERLSRAGYVAVEADDPTKVVVTIPGAPVITDNDITSAALQSISGGGSSTERERFFTAFHALWKAKYDQPKTHP